MPFKNRRSKKLEIGASFGPGAEDLWGRKGREARSAKEIREE